MSIRGLRVSDVGSVSNWYLLDDMATPLTYQLQVCVASDCTLLLVPVLTVLLFWMLYTSTVICVCVCVCVYSVSQKKYPPLRGPDISHFSHKRLRIFNRFFTYLLHVPIYARLQIFIQLSPILTKLCHIKCDYLVLFELGNQVQCQGHRHL